MRRQATPIVRFHRCAGMLLSGSLAASCAGSPPQAEPPAAPPSGSIATAASPGAIASANGAAVDGQRAPRMVSLSQLMRPSPALSEALAREAPAIKAAALLRNSRATEAKGEQQARAIANRIHQALGAEVPEQVVLVQVMNAVAREQMAAAFGQGGPLGAILRTQAAHAGGPLADALNQLGTVDLKAMGEAFRKAYNGQEPAEAARHFRAEFERSEAICRIQAFQSAERSALYQSALRSENALLDAVLTLLDRNPKSAELCRLGYEMAVAYKARSPEVERRISAALAESKSAEARAAREQWRAARESVASLELQLAAGVALDERQRSELSRAQSEERRLVQRLSELARLGRNQDKPFHAADGIEQLKQRLGADEAVLSFVEYRQVKPDDTAAPPPGQGAYCAFVLTRTGLSSVSVGSGESLQQGVEGFLHAVGSAATSIEQKQEVSNHLYERLLAPLEAALSRSPKVQIVPDGVLQLLPFDALYDGKAWLADRYQLSYAFSERQLLGEHAPPLGFGPPLVLVPAYRKKPKPFRAGQKLSQENFPLLDGAVAEGRRVQTLLPGAKLVMGQVTESALTADRPPRVLHIAGHGVLLPLAASTGPDDRGLVLSKGAFAMPAPNSEVDPMVLSTLVLSPDAKGKSDGFLTAYEAAALPLWGTSLVVLSACESGRGSPDRIRGVHGLRRAFFMAGAESLVMSLSSVSDESTGELMSVFYTHIKEGLGRGEALRQASASLRAKTQDPFFWAPFILLGDTTPLSFSEASAAPALAGEDADSRLQRAMALKRLTHSATRMGRAQWASSSGVQQALDAFVTRATPPQRGPLVFTLLGKTESISLVVPDYPGPGSYSIELNQLLAGTTQVVDPLEVDIKKLRVETAATRAQSGTLEVLQDSVASGFIGRFTLRLKDGRSVAGEFRLESALPALPDAMQPPPH